MLSALHPQLRTTIKDRRSWRNSSKYGGGIPSFTFHFHLHLLAGPCCRALHALVSLFLLCTSCRGMYSSRYLVADLTQMQRKKLPCFHKVIFCRSYLSQYLILTTKVSSFSLSCTSCMCGGTEEGHNRFLFTASSSSRGT